MEILFIVLLIALVILALAAVFMMSQMSKRVSGMSDNRQNDLAFGMIKQDIQGINQILNERLDKSSDVMREAINATVGGPKAKP